MSRIAAIIQARLGSTRLPLKSLVCLSGKPVIDWVTGRLAKSRRLDAIVAAVPDTPLDKALAAHLRGQGIMCVEGPENDVLARFVLAADRIGADVVVRVCADNPLIWAPAIDSLVEFYETTGCDYAWNHIPRDNLWPDGLGAEIIGANLLRRLARDAALPSQREHCLNYIWDNADQFRMETFDPAENWLRRPDVKLDMDSPADYARLAALGLAPDMDAAAIISAWDANNRQANNRTCFHNGLRPL